MACVAATKPVPQKRLKSETGNKPRRDGQGHGASCQGFIETHHESQYSRSAVSLVHHFEVSFSRLVHADVAVQPVSMPDDSLMPVKKAARRAIEATIGSKDTQPDPGVDPPDSAQDDPDVDNANDHHPTVSTVSTPTSANAGSANPPIDFQHGSQAASELPELTES